MLKEKQCPQCNKTFIPSRRNQKFCNHEGYKCRNAFNNEKAYRHKAGMMEVEKRLKKNRDILKALFEHAGNREYSKDYLLGAGFNFALSTSQKTIQDQRAFYSYDYGIIELQNSKYKPVKL